MIAVAIAVWLFWQPMARALRAVAVLVGVLPGPLYLPRPVPATSPQVQVAIYLGFGLLLAAALWCAGGPAALGFGPRVAGQRLVALTYAVYGLAVLFLVKTCALLLVIGARSVPSPGRAMLAESASVMEWPWLLTFAMDVQAAVTEDLALIVLPYWLLSLIRSSKGVPLAHTRTGAVLLIGPFALMHLSYGIPGLIVITTLGCLRLLLWRHTADLPVLVGFHIGWNQLQATSLVSAGPLSSLYSSLAWMLLALGIWYCLDRASGHHVDRWARTQT